MKGGACWSHIVKGIVANQLGHLRECPFADHILHRTVFGSCSIMFNPLTPNDHYSGRTAPLTSKRCILYIYSTNIGTAYFKHVIYSPFLSLQNAVCFIILTYLVHALFTFYIQGVLKLKKNNNNSGAKRLTTRRNAVAREPALLSRRLPFKKGHGLKTTRPRALIYIELLRWGA